ncbi:hypothetical protein [Clostridium estertheticum]|uniref:hypothetical protein n=1 Tax=Clostridium estertheticum TaxID=238834 RepID=UPI001C0CEA0B|nr:hypothetical protein [Clostridium estertheticum]MBU3186640.1 hypothetical protein [Clostridium estertheticum]
MIEEKEINLADRLQGEHFLIYLNRLLKLKENKEIDIDKIEIYELVFGEKLSSSEARKRLYNWRDILTKGQEEGQSVEEIVDTISSISSPENIIHLSEEDDNIQVIDMGDKFHIYNKKRSIVIDKEKVKKIKEVYCDKTPLTVNELCRKLDIARRDFMLLKQGLSICHSDVPYLDEDIQDENLGDLVVETLERRKEKYFLKLQQEEIKQMEAELNKYRKQDYLFEKISSEINDIKIEPIKYSVNIVKKSKVREALLDCMDQHLGLKSDNHWNKYSVKEAERRFDILTKETIEFCAETGVSILHVSSLGDLINGLIHTSLRLEAEINVLDQIKLATRLMGKMLIEFALVFDKVIYTDVAGNHGRMMPSKSESDEKENFDSVISFTLGLMLQNEKKIVFEDNHYDEGIIVKHIAGVTIIEAHGDSDKMEKAASTLPLMTEASSEIHLGHTHSNKSIEQNCIEVFVGRSFSGTDSYAKNLRLTSKAGQKLFVYEDGKRLMIHDIVFN